MGRLFGTDGVRGLANADLSPELAMAIAVAAVRTLVAADSSHTPLALVGRDPRASGEMLEAAVVAGLTSAGANVVRVGVLPTPGVAFLTGEVKADLGVMVSASHNPMPDNGIKLFAAGGHKLPDDIEDAIEVLINSGGNGWQRPTGASIGRVHELMDGAEHYLAHLVAAASHPLDGLKVVLDCANGAASDIAPEVFRQVGAEVIAIHAEPDGLNINDGCGATHLDSIKAAVLEHGADLGLAVDGDADRCLAVDASGSEVDGDQLMAILALAMREAGTLTEDTVVATVMSNLGLRIAMREAGINLVETKVGDRYVLEAMKAGGFTLGGEQSGHIEGVGFDLYVRMVGEAVQSFKGELPEDEGSAADVRIDLPVDANLPHEYIGVERLRLEMYRKLASARTLEGLAEVVAEMTDRYGDPPAPVSNLAAVARFRLLVRAYGLTDVGLQGRHIRFSPIVLPDSKQLRLKRLHPEAVYKPAGETISLPRPGTLRDTALLDWCTTLLRDVLGDGVRQLDRQRRAHRHRLAAPHHDRALDQIPQGDGAVPGAVRRAGHHPAQHPPRPVDADEPQSHLAQRGNQLLTPLAGLAVHGRAVAAQLLGQLAAHLLPQAAG
ncbi:MAG TPA: hypothetical protein DGT23_34425, partial [Micromonosporaceae bacterium]|nr:hypothetical protein [Micromonosporaceae bacterium]